MLEAIIKYSEYDNKIVEARVPLSNDTVQVFTINPPSEGEEATIKSDILDSSTEVVLSTKTYTRAELLGYVKLLGRLQKEVNI